MSKISSSCTIFAFLLFSMTKTPSATLSSSTSSSGIKFLSIRVELHVSTELHFWNLKFGFKQFLMKMSEASAFTYWVVERVITVSLFGGLSHGIPNSERILSFRETILGFSPCTSITCFGERNFTRSIIPLESVWALKANWWICQFKTKYKIIWETKWAWLDD